MTTSAQNMGAVIGEFSNSNVLFVDMDPQSNLSKSLGIYLQPGQPHIGTFLAMEQKIITN